jgi:uncharacterized membrane protein required for colicin V production
LRQLFYLLQKLADLTPLYVVNHALGCAAGALKGALGSALVLLLLTPFFSTGAFLGWAWSNAVMQTVSDSFCYQLFLGLWRSLRAGWM